MKPQNYLTTVKIMGHFGKRTLTTMSLFLLFSFNGSLIAQKLQVGLSLGANLTFFHKAKSQYEAKFFDQDPTLRGGLGIPVYIKLNKNVNLNTGLGWHLRRYHFKQTHFDFPDFEGHHFVKVTFNSYELPLVLTYMKESKKKLRFEFAAGTLLTINSPIRLLTEYHYYIYGPLNFSRKEPDVNWASSFSPDIYAGINLVKYKNNQRRHQLSLSYQYSFVPTGKYEMYTTLSSNIETEDYKATINPLISSLKLTYTYFPKRFVTKSKNQGKK